MKQYDVIVIGGGPSGSTSATLLAQKGLSVLLLEKESFPREHVGESLIPISYIQLNKLGLIEELKKISTRKPGVSFEANDGKSKSLWCFKSVIKDESYLAFHVIRSAFDKLLLDNSKKVGAEVREQYMVKNVILDRPDKIVEVHATNADGKEEKFESKFIVDASGQSTLLGRKLGVKKSYADLDRVATWSHWTNTEFDNPLKEGVIKIVYLGGAKKVCIWVIPISKEHLSIGVVVNNDHVKQKKKQFQDAADWKKEYYLGELQESYLYNTVLKNAKMEHKVAMAGDYSYYCEKKYGDNFALVGDAAAFLDPIFSSGIYVGMNSAELVADGIEAKLKGKGDGELVNAYTRITGAVNLLEKFIRLFYTPEALDFSKMGTPEGLLMFKKYEEAYSIFHYLLAGDFFTNYQKYSDFIDIIKDEKSMAKFENLINHAEIPQSCGEEFEKMYGEMTHQIEFDHKAFE